ncbi:MAG: hypothetical protein KAG84_07330 [Bacteroidales bacterium]|nr:hypothetical protein [Bacteroidales bacterium]
MKYLIILLFLFGWFNFDAFEEIDATVQHSNAGRRMSGKSVHYQVKLIANKPSKKITFEKMWIGSNPVELTVFTYDDKKQIKYNYEKGDTIYIDAYMRYRPNDKDVLALVENGLPKKVVEYQGEAIIQYKVKSKRKELIIKSFKKLETVNHP